jgi:hypothetical protein
MFKNKKLTFQEKVLLGATIGVGVFAFVLHRKKIAELTTLSQAAVQGTMWTSFDSGVQYGIQIAQRLAAGEIVSTDDVKEAAKNAGYAFSAFDKAS